MASNLTIESPNFPKIEKESGPFTSDAVSLLWFALNDTRSEQRRGIRLAQEQLAPKVIQVSAASSVNNLDLEGASVVEFTGGSAQNLTGFRAPETGKTRVLIVYVSGAGTITAKHLATSESGNQLFTTGAGDVALSTGSGAIFVYLSSKWRQVV
jgi:hypothetical protein